MRHLDRDLKLLSLANVLYATGLGLYMQLLFVYALQLGASRFAIGALNALMVATIMVVNLPGAWSATCFRLKRVLVAVWWLLVPVSLTFCLAPTWRIADLRSNRAFRGHVAFFFVGFAAVYVAQPFINPYLAQVHGQGYAAPGVYSSIFALGTVVTIQVMGRLTDRWGPRAGAASVLNLMATGSLVLLVGANPGTWALAMVCCGAFDTFRYVPTMILPDSFGLMPLPWGYAIFDTLTGVPMVCGATLGGLVYRTSFALP